MGSSPRFGLLLCSLHGMPSCCNACLIPQANVQGGSAPEWSLFLNLSRDRRRMVACRAWVGGWMVACRLRMGGLHSISR